MTSWKTSWKESLYDERAAHGDDTPIICCTLSDEAMAKQFDAGYGGTNGEPFTAWSETRVYFPICYDGAEWVGSAPRNPCTESLRHQGGG